MLLYRKFKIFNPREGGSALSISRFVPHFGVSPQVLNLDPPGLKNSNPRDESQDRDYSSLLIIAEITVVEGFSILVPRRSSSHPYLYKKPTEKSK
ncbi:hypothetical protein AKJ62_04325 [candidate division MSBL1 archaeon SCGC-AAA259D14]|uniref:Uncharacterized protein n=1 Tax=candidate division MSBL1 archaeon SCGC-AAA259D14 TaxID=1698261 RepID=A0A133U3V6_9EURY|nr:hypothetical protein AKJ62_04325 [candidate division MSBL1 archaeon SCGC-AAA259D14]